jgi:FixJ family two-component response regulator
MTLPSDDGSSTGTVLVVDDDESVWTALSSLFRSVGLAVQTFGSTQDLFRATFPNSPSCIVPDVRLPGQSGLDVPAQLAQAGVHLPIVFMTGFGDIPMSVQAMRAGAVDFLPKPFRDQAMLEAVCAAIERDRKSREVSHADARVRTLFETLSSREKEVMRLVTQGLMNKQVVRWTRKTGQVAKRDSGP